MFAAVGGRSEMVKLLVHRHKATVDEKDPVRWYKFIVVTKSKIHETVLGRNQTLFRCTFQSYYIQHSNHCNTKLSLQMGLKLAV